MKKTKLFVSTLIFAAVLILIFLIDSGLSYVYSSVSTNIIFAESSWPIILEFTLELSQFALWLHVFISLIFLIKRFGTKGSIAPFILTVFLFCLKYLPDMLDISYIYFTLDTVTIGLGNIAISALMQRTSDKISGKLETLTLIIISALIVLNRIGRSVAHDVLFANGINAETTFYYLFDIIYGALIYFAVKTVMMLRKEN